MNMMLLAFFAAIGAGLVGRWVVRTEMLVAMTIAALLTALYFFRPQYMT